MAKVYPFQAIHYDPARVGDLTNVLGQPYDRIDDALQDAYYKKHPNHIVRIDKTKEVAGQDKYVTARKTFEEWLASGVLVQDKTPSFYAYTQVYQTPQGPRVRKGLSAMVRLEEFGKGQIYPHEETHLGPKVDRFKLLSETRLHIGHIFMLYSDAKKRLNVILDEAAKGDPMLEARDDYGEIHRVWPVAETKAIQAEMEDKALIIADGHHRYETALNFRREHPEYGNVLATLFNMEDQGLTIYPTHRAVKEANLANFHARVGELFDVREYESKEEFLEDLRIEGFSRPCFGVVTRGNNGYQLLIGKDRQALIRRIPSDKSDDWKSLDVNILHMVILKDMLGITPEDLAHERKVDYYRWADEVIAAVREGKYEVAFLVNPVKISQIQAVTRRWERFPQKTTDFYPKLLSGLLLCHLK